MNSPDPVTIEPCDICGEKMPDYARQLSELSTKTGHRECVAELDDKLSGLWSNSSGWKGNL